MSITRPFSGAEIAPARSLALRPAIVALMAFFTVVDLFATQAILPMVAAAYRVSPSVAGMAVNACTLGMAVAGLATALFSRKTNRRYGVVASLVLLAVPTSLLALAPDLEVFTLLRVMQGLCMSTAFTLTLAWLGERTTAGGTGAGQAGAFAAYITGNVASNLVGRLVAATVTDGFGLAGNFYLFAGLNLAGAALAWVTMRGAPAPAVSLAGPSATGPSAPLSSRLRQLCSTPLLSGFGIGFCILFAFIGVFTYVNFVLVRPPLDLGMMLVGFVYFVFLPSILLTPLAGGIVGRWGVRPALWTGLGVAALGLPLLLSPVLAGVLLGMVLVGAGTFFAQATATGFVSRAATTDRAGASGIYLAAYFSGGLVGSAALGQAFDRFGWPAAVVGVALTLAVAAILGFNLKTASEQAHP
jgi:MFS transporter, YNFM family, putative membrane transport protein